MIIRKAQLEDLNSIVSIINDSDIGSVYFKNEKEKIEMLMVDEVNQQNIFIGENSDLECIAVLNYRLNGAFCIHPYIHILAVSDENRGQGYGRQLMSYFENIIAPDYKKIFLLVGKWNKGAEKLYTNLGYNRLCEIEGFYSENVTEILMMKEKKK
jgi:N-acetylglutamate synthase-like GNAT family acetyltransferase